MTKSTNRRHRFSDSEKAAIVRGVNIYGVGNWKAIKDANGELLGGRSTVQIKDAWRTLVKRGEVGGGGSTDLPTSGRKKKTTQTTKTSGGGNAAAGAGGNGNGGRKRAAAAADESESESESDSSSSSSSSSEDDSDGGEDGDAANGGGDGRKKKAVAVAAEGSGPAKKRKVSRHAPKSDDDETDDAASSSLDSDDDSLPPPAFGKSARPAPPPTSTAPNAPNTPNTHNDTHNAPNGATTASASRRLEAVNALHPPPSASVHIGAVLRSVRPLQALTGVSSHEIARLTRDVRRLGDEMERCAVHAVVGVGGAAGGRGSSPSSKSKSKSNGSGGKKKGKTGAAAAAAADGVTATKSTDEKGGNTSGWWNARHHRVVITALLILLAVSIDLLVLSELLHVLGGVFIGGTVTVASELSYPPPSSVLVRSMHATLAPKARRPSRRVYDHTKMLGTSLVASMEGLLATSSRHEETEMEERRHHPLIRPPRRRSSAPSVLERTGLYVTQRLMGLNLNEPTATATATATTTMSEANEAAYDRAPLSTMTLRQFIANDEGFHLAMAPAFFGFYALFGALTALNEEVLPTTDTDDENDDVENGSRKKVVLPTTSNLSRYPDDAKPNVLLKSVAGASAGAMAAVFLSAGADPRDAADSCLDLSFGEVADYGGIGAALKGHRFEAIMRDKLEQIGTTSRFGESVLPVAVSGFDLLSMSGRLLDDGCMAKAARASATFPGLFQPVGWNDDDEKNGDDGARRRLLPENLLIDGGIRDLFGLNGLSVLLPEQPKRIVNLVVGDFGPLTPGPSHMPQGIKATEVVSISLLNTPQCGPWAMENGPIAVEAARKAVSAVLDAPMHMGSEPGHYELHIDASNI
eukprot:CAMPEP_0181027036 /NCGR_PEP_ID=MMETSP1070-20121207/3956_1 /TAXON_ID=265543 /ORGANISM="Minutocellus polymorphus, Strain NH13" /LENGTH=863 /DNA_ID=CAMNT_0023104263 /DNA_START=403 /DNA_END=2994 /DNA_ORIENTATION=-